MGRICSISAEGIHAVLTVERKQDGYKNRMSSICFSAKIFSEL